MAPRKAAALKVSEPAVSSDVIEELRRRYDRLTQSQKRIAEYIVEHAEQVAFSTVDQLAAQLEVNPSTIVRFTYRLGLKGFPDLQQRMRQIVRGQLSRASDVTSDPSAAAHLQGMSYGASLSHDIQNLHRTVAGLSPTDLERAVDRLDRARRVYVVAGLSSYPVAHYFALILDRLRSDVILLSPDDAMSNLRLAEIGASDCMVAFTFPRYAASTYRAVQVAKSAKVDVIAVTDSPISAVGQAAEVVLITASAGTGPHNSLVAPMAVANALLNGMVVARGTSGLERYGRVDRLMNKWGALLLNGDESEQ
jgi:DNA-binding MurR/RpiR family transcriptional regulator